MEIKIIQQPLAEVQTAALGVLLVEEKATLPPELVALSPFADLLVASGDFAGKAGQVGVAYAGTGDAARRVVLAGVGKLPEGNSPATVEAIRKGSASVIRKARELKLRSVALIVPTLEPLTPEVVACALVEGAMLANYAFNAYKSADNLDDQVTECVLLASDDLPQIEKGAERGAALAAATNLARDLVNTPPDVCTPSYLADVAARIGEAVGMKVEALSRAQMEALRMGALLAVARGSDTPPRFIIMEHNPQFADDGKTIVLIGKGVTFDTGGYSLKTTEGMVGMKADMSGAAAVIAAMQAIGQLKIPLHVVGLVPAADNMISGKAYRPEEVLTASNGKTIEVISTDAEGRLLLADALVYASRYKPAAVVDIATLTGACVIALGHVAAGLFANDDALAAQLHTAGENAQEKVWRLPLYSEYRKYIDSVTADMKNSGGRDNGVATAAMFLQEFVDYPAWAHVDMAGMMANVPESPYIPAKSAVGYGARLLVEFVRLRADS